eukprot:682692-Rhodomonas_salina.1
MREDLDLEINVEESWEQVPAWAEADCAPAAWAYTEAALAAFPALSLANRRFLLRGSASARIPDSHLHAHSVRTLLSPR